MFSFRGVVRLGGGGSRRRGQISYLIFFFIRLDKIPLRPLWHSDWLQSQSSPIDGSISNN